MLTVADYPKVYDSNNQLLAILDKAYETVSDGQMITSSNGQEVLKFFLPLNDPKRELFTNEDIVKADDSEFIIRTISDGWDDSNNQCVEIYAEAKWYELAEFDPIAPFNLVNATALQAMQQFVSTTDWTVGTVEILTTTDFVTKDTLNPLEGIRMVPTVFGGELYFDNTAKRVHLLNRVGYDRDILYAYGKNMKNNKRVVDTRYLVTRLKPVGKDGLTISSVNGGLDYIENYQWYDALGKTRKVKYQSITNDQITNAAELLAWATPILETASLPRFTYYTEVNLDKQDGIPNIGDGVIIFDKLLGMKQNARVAQRTVNLLEPNKSILQLSVALYSLADQLNNSIASTESKINYVYNETAKVKELTIAAQATADGKNTVFYGSVEPSASVAKQGDLWFQSVNGSMSRTWRFDGVQWQLVTSIIPGDAVQGGTIDFGNVTALNIDAGSISTGTLNAININGSQITGSTITGSTLKTANGSHYVSVDNQFVRIMESDLQRMFLGYFTNTRGELQPTILLGQNATEGSIQDGTAGIFQIPTNSGTLYMGVKKGQISDQQLLYPASIEMNADGYNIVYADNQVTIKSNLIRHESVSNQDILAGGNLFMQSSQALTLNGSTAVGIWSGSQFLAEFKNSGTAGADILLPYLVLRNDSGYNGYLQILKGDASAPWGIVASEFMTSSKREFKENIVDVPFRSLDQLMQVKILQYNLKNDPNRICFGMIADDLTTPVYFVGESRNGVDLYSSLSLTIDSVQELKIEKDSEIQDLVVKNAVLEARLAEIEKKLA